MTGKYRIVVETERSGKKWYYVQEKMLGVWWYLRYDDDNSFWGKKIRHRYIEGAKELIRKESEGDQNRIVKREIIQP